MAITVIIVVRKSGVSNNSIFSYRNSKLAIKEMMLMALYSCDTGDKQIPHCHGTCQLLKFEKRNFHKHEIRMHYVFPKF